MAFSVQPIAHYRRLSVKLLKRHQDFGAVEKRAVDILMSDPLNLSRHYHVKKLEDVAAGEGQFRLALGRWRFRYDVIGQTVLLHYCGLRREDTY